MDSSGNTGGAPWRRQRSTQGSCDSVEPTSCTSADQLEGGAACSKETMAPPPPPPPMMPGALPSVRLNTEIGPKDKGPPAAIASAMMKDKKPFTYTPGGIDLSEIRSPRMAKRIQMNAASEGVTNVPSSSHQDRAPCNLPPAALAAMQPQMAIPVFPQGNMNSVQLNKMQKPADYVGGPPPPPPPPPLLPSESVRPTHIPLAPASPQPTLQPSRQASPPKTKSPIPATGRTPQIERIAPKSPVPANESNMLSSRMTSSQEECRSPVGNRSPILGEGTSGVGTGSLFIPPIESSTAHPVLQPPTLPPTFQSPPVASSSSRPAGQTKAQAVSQNIGSLYIPPISAQEQVETPPSTGSCGSNGNVSVSRTPPSAQATQNIIQAAPSVPGTPQLNKAPTPWMNSYNRIQNQLADSPPYVHPGFFMPPWTGPPGARTIPIMMPRESDQMDGMGTPFPGATDSRRSSSASGGSTPTGSRTPSQAATHLGRVIPIQIEREEAGRAKGAKIIPIQIEGRPPRGMIPATPTTPLMNPMRRGPPPYNSPIGIYSNQNMMDAYQRQVSDAAAGVDRMNIRCDSPRSDPIQSKSMRVIQQAAENELKRIELEQQENLDMTEDDRLFMSLFKSQVDEGSSLHQTAEPRFMGSHIPSKAFRALQTALPTNPSGVPDQLPPSVSVAQPGGSVTHHIPIRQVSQSPAPQSAASEIQLSCQPNVPASEQKVQEPKKYMGSNIPSRSFKMLQAMTTEDGQPVEGSAQTCATDLYNDDAHSPCQLDPNAPLSPAYSSSSYPLSLSCSSEGDVEPALFDPYNIDNFNCGFSNPYNSSSNNTDSENPWSEIVDQGWDPYSYMWYYWWYYNSCYWAGYDMTGYEYPPGWDPNYPQCPPELFSDYSVSIDNMTEGRETNTETAAEHGRECNMNRNNTSLTDLSKSDLVTENEVKEDSFCSIDTIDSKHKDYDNRMGRNAMMSRTENGARTAASAKSSTVPKIVIEDGEIDEKVDSRVRKNGGSVDSIKYSSSNSTASLCKKSSNSSGTCKTPYSNPMTECNQKPGNHNFSFHERNDCDSVGPDSNNGWEGELDDTFACVKKPSSEYEGYGNGNHKKDGTAKAVAYEDESQSASSSDDEYESCCDDSEQKVIERETGPYSSKHLASFPTGQSTPDHVSGNAVEQQESRQTRYEPHGMYESKHNANDLESIRVRNGMGKEMSTMKQTRKLDYEDEAKEKTDPETDEANGGEEDCSEQGVIVEEPETPSSADDSDVTLPGNELEQDQQQYGKSSFYYSNGLSIEEYHSENSSASESTLYEYGRKKNRLSTIDEITESRASSSAFSRTSEAVTPTLENLSSEFGSYAKSHNGHWNGSGSNKTNGEKSEHSHHNAGTLELDDSEESSASDELSSVSVIENKSDATRGTTESKREDETTSTSEEESSSTDDDEENENIIDEEEDDENDDVGADTAVTVRLPLKLCFTKTKSYKDITTVMVGDSEIEESSQASTNDSNELIVNVNTSSTCNNANDHSVNGDNTFAVEEMDDEPIVSFTLSISRQTSREDETKCKTEKLNENNAVADDTGSEDGPDIDFWAEITKGDAEEKRNGINVKVKEDRSNQESRKDDDQENSSEADMGFWGIICKDRSVSDFSRRRRKQSGYKGTHLKESDICREHNEMEPVNDEKPGWDPCERIDYKWEKDFNFWEKSSRTIETRRFSGNFEITEDYESDSGIKPSVDRKERVKKYTHKRHSIPGPPNGWDRSSLPPRPAQKQTTETTYPQSNCNEQEIMARDENGTEEHRKNCSNDVGSGEEMKSEKSKDCTEHKFVDRSPTESESASWWSYWDEVTMKNDKTNEDKEAENASTECEYSREPEVYSLKESNCKIRGISMTNSIEESSVDNKLSEDGNKSTNNGKHFRQNGDDQSCSSMQANLMQTGESFSSENMTCENGGMNSFHQFDAKTKTRQNDNFLHFPKIKCSPSPTFTEIAIKDGEKTITKGSTCISVSDENSDESSSRSSETTIGQHDKSEIRQDVASIQPSALVTPSTSSRLNAVFDVEPRELKISFEGKEQEYDDEEEDDTDCNRILSTPRNLKSIPISVPKFVETQYTDEIQLSEKHQYQEEHHHHESTLTTTTSTINTTLSSAATTTTSSTCTCIMSDRMARAENLLWRIERFLHESLSLGSEDDSGVMTDLSRQISDVDTDVDNDINETEFLLTAAAAVKDRRGMTVAANSSNKEAQHIESCNFGETISSTDSAMHHQKQPSSCSSSINSPGQSNTSTATNCSSSAAEKTKKPRPKSDIFSDTTLLSKAETEEAKGTTSAVEESNEVKMRSASERRALRYQRAKTHSRLFQLLQDECGRDDDQDEFDYDSDVATPTTTYKTSQGNFVAMDCQINVDTNSTDSDNNYDQRRNNCNRNGVNDETNNVMNGTSPTGMNDSQARRSRLLPLPIKNLLASSLSLDSNSSPSGSSGVLSPTSPVNRDQLLADIINEFHLRNQASSIRAQTQRRISASFPSKIFKLLQHEFGEEFYQTFDCCGGEDSLISPSMSTQLCVNDSTSSPDGAPFVHECTIHKSESMKEFEEATNRILTNFMLRNVKAGCCQPFSESPSCTANVSSQLLQDDSKSTGSVDLLDVPLRKKKGHQNRDPRCCKSTNTS